MSSSIAPEAASIDSKVESHRKASAARSTSKVAPTTLPGGVDTEDDMEAGLTSTASGGVKKDDAEIAKSIVSDEGSSGDEDEKEGEEEDEWMDGLEIERVKEAFIADDADTLKFAQILQNVARAMLLRKRASGLFATELNHPDGPRAIPSAATLTPKPTAYVSRTARRRSTATIELPKTASAMGSELNIRQRIESARLGSMLTRKESSMIPAVPTFSAVLEHTRGHRKTLIRKKSELLRQATSTTMSGEYNSPLNLIRRASEARLTIDADLHSDLEKTLLEQKRKSIMKKAGGGDEGGLAGEATSFVAPPLEQSPSMKTRSKSVQLSTSAKNVPVRKPSVSTAGVSSGTTHGDDSERKPSSFFTSMLTRKGSVMTTVTDRDASALSSGMGSTDFAHAPPTAMGGRKFRNKTESVGSDDDALSSDGEGY